MRKGRFLPFGFIRRECGLLSASLMAFLAFSDFWKKSEKMRKGQFPPFGFIRREFGLSAASLVRFRECADCGMRFGLRNAPGLRNARIAE